ncbi:hypothetical protein LINGRAHAP2_LOCUS13526, partial [Linum grandiflorum]
KKYRPPYPNLLASPPSRPPPSFLSRRRICWDFKYKQKAGTSDIGVDRSVLAFRGFRFQMTGEESDWRVEDCHCRGESESDSGDCRAGAWSRRAETVVAASAASPDAHCVS